MTNFLNNGSNSLRQLGEQLKRSIPVLILISLFVTPVCALQSESLDFRVDPGSWYGFYINASEDTTIIIDLNVTSGGETHLLIVDEENFENYRVNETSFHTFESYTLATNLTLTFVVPHSDTWYFLIWNLSGETAKQILGVVNPSPDGYVGNNSGYLISVIANGILVSAVIVPIVACAYLILRRPKPALSNTV